MLRASSLGLNSPPTSILTTQLCRRLCGANCHSARQVSVTATAAPLSSRVNNSTTPQSNTHGTQKEIFNGITTKQQSTLEPRFPSHPSNPPLPTQSHALSTSKTISSANCAGEQTRSTPEKEPRHQSEENERSQVHQNTRYPYSFGRPWSKEPVKPVKFPFYLRTPLKRIITEINEAYSQRLSARLETERRDDGELLTVQPLPYQFISDHILRSVRTLGTTNSVDDAWNAYVFLSDLIAANEVVNKHMPHIPFSHLHRLCRLLSTNRPKTHGQFLRLLAVLTYIKHHNGTIHVHEWNALVDHAGRGWRKTRPQDVKHAMSIFNDMTMGRMPGSVDFLPPEAAELAAMSHGTVVEPNIITYTTLISHAAGAMDSQSIKDVSAMMSKAGLAPNRVTYLALLRYFTQKRNLGGLRSTLEKMREKNLELGLDGLNSCIWAYGLSERLDIVMMVYRVLRHNHIPENFVQGNDIENIPKLLENEFIGIHPSMQPNQITYITVIQIFAYHGHFDAAINVFLDMVSVENMEERAPIRSTDGGESLLLPYQPTFPVFRALFLGFSRHAVPPLYNGGRGDDLRLDWTLDKLQSIFDLFLRLPPETEINHSTVYLIMKAFKKASAGNITVLRSGWEAMEKQFKIEIKPNSSGRLARLKAEIYLNG